MSAVVIDKAETLRVGDRVFVPPVWRGFGEWMTVADITPPVYPLRSSEAYTPTQMNVRIHPVGDDETVYLWGPQKTDFVRIIRGGVKMAA